MSTGAEPVPDLDALRDEARQLAEELRAVFARERSAIGALDHAALETLAREKLAVVEALRRCAAALGPAAVELRELFAALRVEAQASAMLAATATQAVRALLGYEPQGTYDRQARRAEQPPLRTVLTY